MINRKEPRIPLSTLREQYKRLVMTCDSDQEKLNKLKEVLRRKDILLQLTKIAKHRKGIQGDRIKTAQLKQVPVGKTFEVWDRKFTVLRSDEDKVFVLAVELEKQMPFREEGEVYKVAPNDFRDSTARNWLNNEYLGLLQEKGLKNDDILDLEINLKCTLEQHEYGMDKVKAGLLTLEQYGEYYDIIPKVDDWWCLATPWKTPSRSPLTSYASYVWCVRMDGDYIYNYCSNMYGVRPALNLSPSLLVTWEDENCEEDTEEVRDRNYDTQ